MARIDNLNNFLTDVAESIRTKKGTTDLISPSNFDTEIESIESGGDISEYFISSFQNAGINKSVGRWIDIIKKLPGFDVGGSYKNLYTGFIGTYIDTSHLQNAYYDYSYMFASCTNLVELDVSILNTEKATTFERMFYNCTSLKELDLSNFVTTKLTNTSWMFHTCSVLEKLDIRNFEFINITSYTNMLGAIPTDCLIIVKDETAKSWITEKFTTLTNVKTVAELES